jgi:hypothetical protein
LQNNFVWSAVPRKNRNKKLIKLSGMFSSFQKLIRSWNCWVWCDNCRKELWKRPMNDECWIVEMTSWKGWLEPSKLARMLVMTTLNECWRFNSLSCWYSELSSRQSSFFLPQHYYIFPQTFNLTISLQSQSTTTHSSNHPTTLIRLQTPTISRPLPPDKLRRKTLTTLVKVQWNFTKILNNGPKNTRAWKNKHSREKNLQLYLATLIVNLKFFLFLKFENSRLLISRW